MDKLDRNTLKVESKVIILKKKNKKENVNQELPEENKIPEKKKQNFDIDNFDNICNGNNYRKIFKIYEYLSPDLFNIYVFLGKVNKDIDDIIKKIDGSYKNISKKEKEILEKRFKKKELELF